MRALPLAAETIVWIAFLPWLPGLAAWESRRRASVRPAVVGALAAGSVLASFPKGVLMSQPATGRVRSAAAPAQQRASVAWFVFMVGSWVAFLVLLLASPDGLERLWSWVRGLPLLAELAMWVLLLPWLLGIAVWESSWEAWVRALVVAALALGWSLVSLPRNTAGAASDRGAVG